MPAAQSGFGNTAASTDVRAPGYDAPMQRMLILAGLALLLIGLGWPWLSRLPLGRLPGDLLFERPGVRVYIPLATMLLVSLVLSVLAWLLRR